MSFVINTNVMSLVAQQNLDKSNNMLNQAITRLSSGKKINSAADDAAGQAISNRMTAQISGLSQAKSNANDGISLGQTTEGALDQINDNLQRIRVLSVQAANGTYSDSDLASMQEEIDERLNEIDRVSAQTTFNGVHVLADDHTLSIQVGDNDDETININLNKITSSTLGLSALNMTEQYTTDGLTKIGADSEQYTPANDVDSSTTQFYVNNSDNLKSEYDLVVGSKDSQLYAKDADGGLHAATFDADNGTLAIAAGTTSSGVTGSAIEDADAFMLSGSYVDVAKAENAEWSDGTTTDYEYYLNDDGDLWAVETNSHKGYNLSDGDGSVNWETGQVTLGSSDATGSASAPLTSAGATLGGANKITSGVFVDSVGTTSFKIDMSDANLDGTNTLYMDDDGQYVIEHKDDDTGATTYYEASVNVNASGVGSVSRGDEVIVDPLAALDDALSQVDTLRSNLGAMQNRFDSAIANLSTTNTNLKAARSRIVDANYAEVVSALSKSQILQQAGTSVLSQANQSQQSVLSLLR